MASGNLVAAKYVTDDNKAYVMPARKAITDQQGVGLTSKVGFAAGDQADPALPTNHKPRYVLVVSAAGVIRKVVCYTNTADLYTGVETTIQLTYNGADTVFTRKSVRGERPARKISQTS